jgi:hypothetical protein
MVVSPLLETAKFPAATFLAARLESTVGKKFSQSFRGKLAVPIQA